MRPGSLLGSAYGILQVSPVPARITGHKKWVWFSIALCVNISTDLETNSQLIWAWDAFRTYLREWNCAIPWAGLESVTMRSITFLHATACLTTWGLHIHCPNIRLFLTQLSSSAQLFSWTRKSSPSTQTLSLCWSASIRVQNPRHSRGCIT